MAWLDRFRAFRRVYPISKTYDYDSKGRPVVTLWIGSKRCRCLVDTGANIIVLPSALFLEFLPRLDLKEKLPFATAKKGETCIAYPLVSQFRPLLVRIDGFEIVFPLDVLFSMDVDSDLGILGVCPLLKTHAFFFGEDTFRIFVRAE